MPTSMRLPPTTLTFTSPIASTPTPAPTDTPTLSPPTATATVIPPTSTETAIPTATLPPAFFTETFDTNAQNWDLAPYRRVMADGIFNVSNNGSFPYAAEMPIQNQRDVEVVVDAMPLDPASKDAVYYGVSCRLGIPGYNQYLIGVTSLLTGQYLGGIAKVVNGNVTMLVELTPIQLPAAASGFGVTLHVVCKGQELKLIGAGGAEIKATDGELVNGGVALTVFDPQGSINFIGFDNLLVIKP
jgi:hypothetical protein